jgi:hypothetical protein
MPDLMQDHLAYCFSRVHSSAIEAEPLAWGWHLLACGGKARAEVLFIAGEARPFVQ